MSLATLFGFASTDGNSEELRNIFPLGMTQIDFIEVDIVNIYTKILTDTIERTHGLTDELQPILWDNCLKSESHDGLITLLAKAMSRSGELFLVYDKPTKVLRKATSEEAAQITADYIKQAKSSVGIYISFKNYLKSSMVRLYSALEYCTVSSLNKSINLSTAIQIKINDLRGSVAMTDAAAAKAQIKVMSKSLAEGKDIYMDSKDEVITQNPDLTAIKTALEFLNQKRAFYLGMPDSYICGELNSGLGDSGQADQKAVERGLKNYYFSVIKPALEALFGEIKITYKSQDLAQITGSTDVLKTFALVDEELISKDNKTLIVNRLFDLPEDAKGDPPPKVDPLTGLPPGQVPPPPAGPPFNAPRPAKP